MLCFGCQGPQTVLTPGTMVFQDHHNTVIRPRPMLVCTITEAGSLWLNPGAINTMWLQLEIEIWKIKPYVLSLQWLCFRGSTCRQDRGWKILGSPQYSARISRTKSSPYYPVLLPENVPFTSCDDCLGWVVFRKAIPWLSTLVLSWVTPEPHSHMDLHNLRVSWGLCHRKWYELIYDCILLEYIYLPNNVIVMVNS